MKYTVLYNYKVQNDKTIEKKTKFYMQVICEGILKIIKKMIKWYK